MNATVCLLLWAMFSPVLAQPKQKVDVLSRGKRFLIFPRQAPTRHQFIAGIGIPADLDYESLTVGYVLKAEFLLPYNASVYRQNPLFPEYKISSFSKMENQRKFYENPTHLRWRLYDFMEHLLNGYGFNGHACLLQAICDANRIGFAQDFSVLADILYILLRPSSTLNSETDLAHEFVLAERDGLLNKCEHFNCNIKLLNWVSRVNKINI
ncbi:hypothetical protein KR009_010520 [Drosophila setifemur]|nr:hypothetical protein KR009_010520 [Drosophila setifemur]